MRDFAESFDEIVSAYVATALWSSYDMNDIEPQDSLDANYDASDISAETMISFRRDIADFLDLLLDIEDESFPKGIRFADIESRMTWGQFGHDFWLTRNHHGAGFWDRGLGEFGDILTRWAQTFGEVNLYVNDDNEIEAD